MTTMNRDEAVLLLSAMRRHSSNPPQAAALDLALRSLSSPPAVPDGFVLINEGALPTKLTSPDRWPPGYAGGWNDAVMMLDFAVPSRWAAATPVADPADAEDRDDLVTWADANTAMQKAYMLGKRGEGYTEAVNWLHDYTIPRPSERSAAPSPSEPPSGCTVDEVLIALGQGHIVPSPAEQGKHATYEDFIRLATDPNRKPAEQGAREDEHPGCGHTHAEHANERQGCINAPLAAGRVGVNDAMMERALATWFERNVTGTLSERMRAVADEIAAALAGPVVAGEVAKCQHVNDVIGADRMRFCNVCGEQKGYADTAKGGES